MKELLEDTYRPLNTDPTMKQKNKLINILRRVKTEAKLEDTTYRRMYPTGTCSPKLYGLPKIHKKNTRLRPIVSSRGSVTYGVARELAKIQTPLTGNTIHYVSNSKEFAEEIMKNKLERVNASFPMMSQPFYFHPREICYEDHKEQIGTRQITQE